MEPKYITIDQLAKELMAKPPKFPPHYYDCCPPQTAQFIRIQPIVTEDIDYEIVEPLPAPTIKYTRQ